MARLGNGEGQRVGGEGAGRAAEDVAGELVEGDDGGQGAVGTGERLVDGPRCQLLDQWTEARADRLVDGGIAHEPRLAAELAEPEAQHIADPGRFGRRGIHGAARRPARRGFPAAASATWRACCAQLPNSSRSSSRRSGTRQ